MYIQRHAEQALRKLVNNFKVVLITGPRQVGKSTMLKEMYGNEYRYVTLEDINELEIAKNDPKLFFLNHPGKLIIEEAGKLFPIEIKHSASPKLSMVKNMAVLDKAQGYTVELQTILAQVEKSYLLTEDTVVSPIATI